MIFRSWRVDRQTDLVAEAGSSCRARRAGPGLQVPPSWDILLEQTLTAMAGSGGSGGEGETSYKMHVLKRFSNSCQQKNLTIHLCVTEIFLDVHFTVSFYFFFLYLAG